MTQYTVIDTPGALEDALTRLRAGTGPIAVDTERASGFRYSQRAYLVQLFRRESGTFLIDPPAFGRLDAVEEAIGSETWILHAASQDLPCLREVGLDPADIFDTELAARLLGMPRVGLGTVVEELLGIHLEKAYSAVDWSTRPLPQDWLVYAALDVELLVDLQESLADLLEHDEKAGIAREEFQAELAATPSPTRTERWRRLSGLHAVKGRRRLAVARSLWRARDSLARERDIAPGRLLPDSAVIAAAVALPATRRELLTLSGFTGRASRKQADLWWSAIEEGRATEDPPTVKSDDPKMPPTRSWRHRAPEAATRLDAAKEVLRTLSDERHIPAENLLRPAVVRELAWSPPEVLDEAAVDAFLAEHGARSWQRAATAGPLVAALQEAASTAPAPEVHA